MNKIPQVWSIIDGRVRLADWSKGINLPAREYNLRSQGIERNWLCIINPVMVRDLLTLFKHMPKFDLPADGLEWVTGRRTWTTPHAPLYSIEYMSMLMFARKYPLAWKAEMQAKRNLKNWHD